MRRCIYGYKINLSGGLRENFSFLGGCGWGLKFIFGKIVNVGGNVEYILCKRIFDIFNNFVIKYFFN